MSIVLVSKKEKLIYESLEYRHLSIKNVMSENLLVVLLRPLCKTLSFVLSTTQLVMHRFAALIMDKHFSILTCGAFRVLIEWQRLTRELFHDKSPLEIFKLTLYI